MKSFSKLGKYESADTDPHEESSSQRFSFFYRATLEYQKQISIINRPLLLCMYSGAKADKGRRTGRWVLVCSALLKFSSSTRNYFRTATLYSRIHSTIKIPFSLPRPTYTRTHTGWAMRTLLTMYRWESQNFDACSSHTYTHPATLSYPSFFSFFTSSPFHQALLTFWLKYLVSRIRFHEVCIPLPHR